MPTTRPCVGGGVTKRLHGPFKQVTQHSFSVEPSEPRDGAAETLPILRPLYPGLKAERQLAKRAELGSCAEM